MHRLQSSRRAAIAVEEMESRLPGPDRDVSAVRVDRHECRVGWGCSLLLDLEISIQQKQAGVLRLDEQSDQAAVIADRGRVDAIGHARERERLALSVQEIKLVPFIPGEDRSRLTGEGKPLQRRVSHDGPGRCRVPTESTACRSSRSSVAPGSSVQLSPSRSEVLRASYAGVMSSRRLAGGAT